MVIYHEMTENQLKSKERKVMKKNLFYIIMLAALIMAACVVSRG